MKNLQGWTDNIKVEKWQGIRNKETKQVGMGYLWVRFLKDTTIANVNPNKISLSDNKYKAGQCIGFSVQAANRSAAIELFTRDNQIVH